MILASLLLPSDVLASTWFRVFSLFVAINTLLYLGLTLSKFVPWPQQMHPRQVRALLSGSSEAPTARTSEHRLADDLAAARSGGDRFVIARRSAAARSVYRALGLLGIQVVAVNLAQLVVFPHVSIPISIISMSFGLTGIIASIALGRHRERPALAIWLWALLATGFVLMQCIHAIGQRVPLDVADAIIVLVLIPPIALSWPASLVSSGVCAIAIMTSAVIDSGSDSLATLFAIVSATFGGLIVMHLRRRAIDESTSMAIALSRHRTTDPTTGTLSIDALRTLSTKVFSLGERLGLTVHLARLLVEDLGSLRLDYGEDYVRVLLASIAEGVDAVAEPGELLARSGDAEFLLLGLGELDPDALHARLAAHLAVAPVDLGRRRTALSISVVFDAEAARSLDPATRPVEDPISSFMSASP